MSKSPCIASQQLYNNSFTTRYYSLYKDYDFDITFETVLKDAIDLSRFLVDLTINYQRFENNSIATCGGPIDTLVITKDGASFAKHKIYKP